MSLQPHLPTLLILTDHSPLFFWFKKHLSKQFSLLHGSDLSVPTSEGDFLILTKFDPKQLAQNLTKHIQKHVFKNKKKSVSITTSIAIASLKAEGKPFDQILQTAIQALHQSHSTPNKILLIDKDRLS